MASAHGNRSAAGTFPLSAARARFVMDGHFHATIGGYLSRHPLHLTADPGRGRFPPKAHANVAFCPERVDGGGLSQ
jgi:hypothetical protein